MINKITLSGLAGSGKSTVGKLLASKRGCEFISVGNFTRKLAKETYGKTINEFQDLLATQPELDDLIDKQFADYCNRQNNIVVDYRLGFHFIKDAYHVLLTVSDDTAYQRISLDNRALEDFSHAAIMKRNKQMKERFLDRYEVGFTDEKNYDLVVDTGLLSVEEVVDIILRKMLT